MKRCFKCGVEKPLKDFYRHPEMGDGRLGKCKECAKLDIRKTRHENAVYYRAYDKKRNKDPRRVAAQIIRNQKRRSKGDGYTAAHSAVARALRKGILAKQKCQMCGTDKNVYAHHDDYSKPLEVIWLCPTHHRARHDYLAYIGNETF